MATVFWDAQGIIRIDYLKKGQTITGEYYATLLSRLHEKLQTERSKLAHKKILSIKTTHRLILPQFQWQKCMN